MNPTFHLLQIDPRVWFPGRTLIILTWGESDMSGRTRTILPVSPLHQPPTTLVGRCGLDSPAKNVKMCGMIEIHPYLEGKKTTDEVKWANGLRLGKEALLRSHPSELTKNHFLSNKCENTQSSNQNYLLLRTTENSVILCTVLKDQRRVERNIRGFGSFPNAFLQKAFCPWKKHFALGKSILPLEKAFCPWKKHSAPGKTFNVDLQTSYAY